MTQKPHSDFLGCKQNEQTTVAKSHREPTSRQVMPHGRIRLEGQKPLWKLAFREPLLMNHIAGAASWRMWPFCIYCPHRLCLGLRSLWRERLGTWLHKSPIRQWWAAWTDSLSRAMQPGVRGGPVSLLQWCCMVTNPDSQWLIHTHWWSWVRLV